MPRPTNSLAILVLVGLAGCASTPNYGTHSYKAELELLSVDRPADVADRWGPQTSAPADSAGYRYEDDLLSVVLIPAGGSFVAQIENRTENTFRVIWSGMAYVGPTGSSSGVVSGETRWMDMNQTNADTPIPAGARAELLMIPRANLNTSARQLADFVTPSLGCEALGKEVRLIVPFGVREEIAEYTFRFTIPRVERIEFAGVLWGVAPPTRVSDCPTVPEAP